MNAPVNPAALEAPLEYIPLGSITPSETHIQKLRRARYNMESLADLRSSIQKIGVQQPGVVRKLKALRGLASYELVAGERRFRAAGQAGLHHFPAIVRELSDDQVLEIQLVENLQREDLHPLEEAAGYAELMKVGKLKKEQLGDRVGKSRSWVYSRLNLLQLPKEAQDAMQTGILDVSRALVVASIAQPNQQAQVLQMAIERNNDNNPVYSVRQLRDKVLRDRLTYPLKGAPFPVEDAGLLPNVGACAGCPFRTGNCDPDAPDPDVCTNVACFHLKTKAHGDRRRQEVLAKGGKVLKGEEARKVSPSVNTVYGHVDLDLVCECDDFPEKEPKLPKGIDRWDDEADKVPEMIAWRQREEAWQPRTYRALLDGQKYQSVLIDDPKTKALRELVPFKAAQLLLKKVGIDLPSHYNRKRHSFQQQRSTPEPKLSKEAQEKQAAAEKAQMEKLRADEAIVATTMRRVLEQLKAKHDGTLGVEELLLLGDQALQDLSNEADVVFDLFKLKNPGWQVDKALVKLSSKDLPRFIGIAMVALDLSSGHPPFELADKVCARFKIDRKKIEKEVRAAAAKKADKK